MPVPVGRRTRAKPIDAVEFRGRYTGRNSQPRKSSTGLGANRKRPELLSVPKANIDRTRKAVGLVKFYIFVFTDRSVQTVLRLLSDVFPNFFPRAHASFTKITNTNDFDRFARYVNLNITYHLLTDLTIFLTTCKKKKKRIYDTN